MMYLYVMYVLVRALWVLCLQICEIPREITQTPEIYSNLCVHVYVFHYILQCNRLQRRPTGTAVPGDRYYIFFGVCLIGLSLSLSATPMYSRCRVSCHFWPSQTLPQRLATRPTIRPSKWWWDRSRVKNAPFCFANPLLQIEQVHRHLWQCSKNHC